MNALEIKNLTKSFSGFTLDNISLTLPSGCIMGLIGENGARYILKVISTTSAPTNTGIKI